MRFALLVAAGLCLAAPVRAQEEEPPAPSDRVLESPPETTTEPGDERKVLGADKDKKPKVIPPPPRKTPEAPRAKVVRDKDGNVVMPHTPEPLLDPLTPQHSELTGVQRANLTTQQILASVVAGAPGFLCGLCACPMIFLLTTLNPLLGFAGAGIYFAMLVPIHVVTSGIGLVFPAYFRDSNFIAAGAAAAVIAAVDLVTLLLGGVVATMVLLRWAPAPQNAYIRLRGPVNIAVLPEVNGTMFGLVVNVFAATAVAVFVAPLLGALTYVLVAYLGGEPEAPKVKPAEPTEDKPAPRRRRRRRTA